MYAKTMQVRNLAGVRPAGSICREAINDQRAASQFWAVVGAANGVVGVVGVAQEWGRGGRGPARGWRLECRSWSRRRAHCVRRPRTALRSAHLAEDDCGVQVAAESEGEDREDGEDVPVQLQELDFVLDACIAGWGAHCGQRIVLWCLAI